MPSTLQVPFVCQREQSSYTDNSCGTACLMMMLKYHHLDQGITYETLCKALRIDLEPSLKGYPASDSKGIYPEDMHCFLIGQGWPYRVHFYPDEWQLEIGNGPIAVLIASGSPLGYEDGHWMLVVSVTHDSFTLLDPWKHSNDPFRAVELDTSAFYNFWTGIACQALKPS